MIKGETAWMGGGSVQSGVLVGEVLGDRKMGIALPPLLITSNHRLP